MMDGLLRKVLEALHPTEDTGVGSITEVVGPLKASGEEAIVVEVASGDEAGVEVSSVEDTIGVGMATSVADIEVWMATSAEDIGAERGVGASVVGGNGRRRRMAPRKVAQMGKDGPGRRVGGVGVVVVMVVVMALRGDADAAIGGVMERGEGEVAAVRLLALSLALNACY